MKQIDVDYNFIPNCTSQCPTRSVNLFNYVMSLIGFKHECIKNLLCRSVEWFGTSVLCHVEKPLSMQQFSCFSPLKFVDETPWFGHSNGV